ncbi:MAG: transporter [Cyclobacteriaceae bacterium]|nr:transporter [Cyclobacteriaceae bacterium]
MNTIRLPGVVLLFISFYSSVAQIQLNELTVDRPGIAEAPFTVTPGMFQLETGIDYYKRTAGEIYFLPVSLFRTGLSRNTELRVSIRNLIDKTTTQKLKGISPITIGIKTHIIEQKGWIPETDILVDLIFPMGNSDLQPDRVGHDVLLLFQNNFSPKVAINYNVGVIWDGFVNEDLFTASMCFNYLPSDKLGFFIEYYNFIRTKETQEHGVDGGFTFLLHRMIQADLSAGISRISGNTNHFISSGISFRIE